MSLKSPQVFRLRLVCIICVSLPFFASRSDARQQTSSVSSAIADLVRAEYSGDSAYESVAYVDQYIRWPGNRGFDASIDHIVERLEAAGFVREDQASDGSVLTYRLEHYPMNRQAWEPLGASVMIEGESEPILSFATNRNMLATYSFATPASGITAELVDAGTGAADFDALDVRGKIVLVDGRLSQVFGNAVIERGAVGVLAYSMTAYLQPEKNRNSIQFRRVQRDETARSWGIALSFAARERLRAELANGPVRLLVKTDVRWTPDAVERTVVADIHGRSRPDKRFVFSAHVQETGANDNASGVGAQLEMARVAATLVRRGEFVSERSITFLWGDEIRSTARYIQQDSLRAKGILWGMSLDMVGEDTEKTGGTFLIEKMPDPSGIWTRGEESHTEWGGRPLAKDNMTPHYFNDLVLGRALEQASTNGWVVKTNPYEGGSDHVPFLRAGIPGLLLWHFTDQFYHTDGDRIDMVSADVLKNVGVTALVTALTVVSADGQTARGLIEEVSEAAVTRLKIETNLSLSSIEAGGSAERERDILETWTDWYDGALASTTDIEVGGSSPETLQAIELARNGLKQALETTLKNLGI